MTKERELLRRVVDCLKHSYRPIDRDILIDDIEAFLAEGHKPLSEENIWEIEQSIPRKAELKAAKLLFARKIEVAHGIGDKHD